MVFIKSSLDNGKFEFPLGFDSGAVLNDLLEKTVEEKYYIGEERLERFFIDIASSENLHFDRDSKLRVRKLTPRECWRLMGFSDNDFNLAKGAGVCDSQLYKQAGNSIVCDVLYHIYKNLYSAMPELFINLKLMSFFSGIGAFEVALKRLFIELDGTDVNFSIPSSVVKGGGKL